VSFLAWADLVLGIEAFLSVLWFDVWDGGRNRNGIGMGVDESGEVDEDRESPGLGEGAMVSLGRQLERRLEALVCCRFLEG